METTNIHIPLNDGSLVQVQVQPHKIYGNVTGSELIERYSKKKRTIRAKVKYISSIQWEKEPHKGNLTIDVTHVIGKGKTEDILKLEWTPKTIRQIHRLNLTNPLQKQVKIGNSHYSPILLLQILEEILHKKLICRAGNRPIKNLINTCIEIAVICDTEECRPLVIFGKNGTSYVLAPRFLEQ